MRSYKKEGRGAEGRIRTVRKDARSRADPGENEMCRNIRTLFNFDPPANDQEVREASLQFVRKVSGFSKPSRANDDVFDRAVVDVAAAVRNLLDSLVTGSEPLSCRGRGPIAGVGGGPRRAPPDPNARMGCRDPRRTGSARLLEDPGEPVSAQVRRDELAAARPRRPRPHRPPSEGPPRGGPHARGLRQVRWTVLPSGWRAPFLFRRKHRPDDDLLRPRGGSPGASVARLAGRPTTRRRRLGLLRPHERDARLLGGLAAYAALGRRRWTRKWKHAAECGAEFYLERGLLREGRQRYTSWERLHYPVHYYYDVLVGLETLAHLGYGDDSKTKPARELLRRKMRHDGTWTMDAVHPDIARGANYHREPSQRFVLERVNAQSKWITLRALYALGKPA